MYYIKNNETTNMKSFIKFITPSFLEKEHPLSKSFDLYIEKDLKLALSLMSNGYIPNSRQNKALLLSLSSYAKKNINFLSELSDFASFIPSSAFITYCQTYDLSTKCKNEKTMISNMKELFVQLSKRDDFIGEVIPLLIKNIELQTKNVMNIKPYSEIHHYFKFSRDESEMVNSLCASIYNVLSLIPYLDNMDTFVLVKSSINHNTQKIKSHLSKHNVKITVNNHPVHYYYPQTLLLFKVQSLDSWCNYINEYDVENLKNNLLKILNKKENLIESKTLDHEINRIKVKLEKHHIEKVEIIQSMYTKLKLENFINYDLEGLYKDMLSVMNKYLSIPDDMRKTFKNIQSQTPEDLMLNSFDMIEEKFKTYLHNVTENKVSELSVEKRKIQMKM